MKAGSDSFTDARIREALASWSKSQISDGSDRPPELLIELLRVKLLDGHENTRHGLRAFFRPPNRHVPWVFRVVDNPSGLNHKIKRL